MKALLRFMLSVKTAFGAFLVFIVLAFIGSLSLVGNLAFFSGIDDAPLFKWLSHAGRPGATWWIYALIALFVFLAANTICCTAEALLKRMGLRNLVLKLSPQVMHIGVLLIMLGHLLTASMGFKKDILVAEGKEALVQGDVSISLDGISTQTDEAGYFTDWEAAVGWLDAGRVLGHARIRPARPLYIGNYGLYIKSVATEPERTALIRVCRDPGALWALAGGILLCLGGAGFIYGRAKT
jgi:hypothetical protein